MADDSTWWLVGLGVAFVGLLWWRQIALAVVLVCAVYAAAQYELIDVRMPSMPASVKQGVAERQQVNGERARRYACERRAVAALSRDDGRALARVHADCGDVFTGDPAGPAD